MKNQLSTERILSIDALRGITIAVMIFVNELAGVQNIPAWMKHMPASADAMTFVDAVFPAFLFIVGMSIPFALNTRIKKGDSVVALQAHILFRTIGLLVLGVFMVNAEGGYNEQAMGMPIYLWSLLFYVSVILVWNAYTFSNVVIAYALRGIGVVGLVVLAMLYRGGDDGTQTLTPQWWGILGLIGWAYLGAVVFYQLWQGRIVGMVAMSVLCTVVYILGKQPAVEASSFGWISALGGHASHTSIVLNGIILALLFFDNRIPKTIGRRFAEAGVFALVLFVVGFALRPVYELSKIRATPSWCMYSSAFCCVLFMVLYEVVDRRSVRGWFGFMKPAAANPLLTYIVPFIVYALMGLCHLTWPAVFYQGVYGIVWSAVFAVLVIATVPLLNRAGIKLRL